MNEYVKELQKLLRLQDWDITLEENSMLETDGICHAIYNDFKMTIQVKASLSDKEKKETILYEMVHAIMRDCCNIATESIEDEWANKYFLRTHERGIEQIAKILDRLINPK